MNPAVERGFVSAFVRRWYSVGDIKVKLRGCISEKYIFILGSCVSRDAFPSSRNLAGYRASTGLGRVIRPLVPLLWIQKSFKRIQ